MKLIIYDYEIVNIKVPFPYIGLETYYKKWVKIKLKKSGFDLNKTIVNYYSPEYCGRVYEQDE